LAFLYVPELGANQATPWLGLTERISQYANQFWQATLAILLLLTKVPDHSQSTVYRINPS
jgi:hypothetical protein